MIEEKTDQKTERLRGSVRVDASLHERIKAIVPKGHNIGHVWDVAAELFLALPPDDRLDLVLGRLKPADVLAPTRDLEAAIDREARGAQRQKSPRRARRAG